MKKVKRFTIALSALSMVVGLVGCGNNNPEKNKWSLDKEDIENLIVLNPYVEESNGTTSVSVDMSEPIFSKAVDKDGIIIFNPSNYNLKEYDDYSTAFNYNYMSQNSVSFDSVVCDDDLSALKFTSTAKLPEYFAALVHKDYTASGAYICVTNIDESKNLSDEPVTPDEASQEEFEKKYASQQMKWDEGQGAKFVVDILCNIGGIIGGLTFDSPATCVVSFFNILNSIAGNFIATGPTTADIMNKLVEMDKKLDQILSTLEANQKKLEDEAVRTQAAVDKVQLEQYNQAIRDFKRDYLDKIYDFNSIYAVTVNEQFKNIVKGSGISVDVYLYQNDNKEWCARILSENGLHAGDKKVTFSMSDFTNARNQLASNGNIIKQGFMDALYKDIDLAINTKELPEGLKKENFRYFAAANITETINKNYFSANKTQAKEFYNLMLHTCEQYLGGESPSILATYFNRFKMIYNFMGELKKPMTSFIAKHLYNLDMNVAKATTYMAYAEQDDSELAAKFKVARKNMNTFYDDVNKLEDAYSNILGYKLKTGLYNLHYEQWWATKGNHPKWDGKLIQRYYEYVNGKLNIYDTNIFQINSIASIDHTRIQYRRQLMCEVTGTEAIPYIDYLAKYKVVEQKVLDARKHILSLNWAPSIDKIATGFKERDMSNNDSNISLKCTEKSNGKSYYFNENQWYNYKGSRNSNDWSGKILESDMYDYKTMAPISSKMVCARARYSEGHWYWRNDEDWLFTTYDGVYVFDVCKA